MATKLIQNGATSGALAGLLATRSASSAAPTDYATLANIANAIGDAVVTANAALGAPMADADNAEIGYLVLGAAQGAVMARSAVSIVAADYVDLAEVIVAAAKQTVAALV